MRTFIVGLFLAVSLVHCKPQPQPVAQVKSEAEQSYNREGRCVALNMIADGYTQQQFWQHKAIAKSRVDASEPVWRKVGNDRAKKQSEDNAVETAEGNATGAWIKRYQSRGYLQPAYLAGFGDGFQSNGSNEWDIFHKVLNRVEKAANNLAREIKLSNDTTLSVRQTFAAALQQTRGDPLRAAGFLGSTTVWDRWRAEDLTIHNGGGRNDYTVLPHQMSPVGPGDQTGQIYHFWGYVGWVMSNKNLLNGAVDAAFVSGAYEGFGNYIRNGKVDSEDWVVDNRAIEFAIGLRGTFNESDKFQPGKALEKMRELNCGQQLAQPSSTINQDIGKCEVWFDNAATKAESEAMVPQLITKRTQTFFHSESIDACQDRTRNSLGQYRTFIKGTNGELVNFAYWVYSKGTPREKSGLISDLWNTPSIRTAEETGICKRANSSSGKCGSLKFECSRVYCNPSSAEYISCNQEKEYAISLCMYQNSHCLSNGNNCVENPERFKDIPNRTTW